MNIYLAGSVPKGQAEEKNYLDWRLAYKDILSKFFDADFIFPMSGKADEADFLLIVGKDCGSIKDCDLVVVNAESKLGTGTSMEMVVAKYFHKIVVTVLPKNSHHRRSNMVFQGTYAVEDWIHPFIHTFSDYIVEDVSEIESLKDTLFTSPAKDIAIIDKAIEHYLQNGVSDK